MWYFAWTKLFVVISDTLRIPRGRERVYACIWVTDGGKVCMAGCVWRERGGRERFIDFSFVLLDNKDNVFSLQIHLLNTYHTMHFHTIYLTFITAQIYVYIYIYNIHYTPWVNISVRRGPLSCVSVSQWQRHRQVVAGFALWWRAGWQSRRKTQHTDPGWLVSISEVDALVRKGYQEWSSAFNTLVQIFISTD